MPATEGTEVQEGGGARSHQLETRRVIATSNVCNM